jgi:hypothetical protein
MANIENWSTSSFEEKSKAMMAGMSEVDQKKSAGQVLHLCQCNKCPTCTDAKEAGAVLCILGKSEVIHEQKGCLCSECGLTKTMSMRWEYYCTQGSAVNLSDL